MVRRSKCRFLSAIGYNTINKKKIKRKRSSSFCQLYYSIHTQKKDNMCSRKTKWEVSINKALAWLYKKESIKALA